MKPEEWQRVRALLESALELEPADRARFLGQECPSGPLRHEVESLIEVHEQSDTDVLSSPAIAGLVAEEEAEFRLRPGQRIGAYEILGEIAQGGMGAVYRAVRADGQYTQEVALKIVRAGFGAQLTAARFRNERQILASLDHPNIAKLLDGGTTAAGLPYFVMEFIDGQQITEYCDQHDLSINARLELFRKVCGAVHYAHQRLVIHRDVKPSNILVTADGIPKLLDFGIAKVLDRNQGPRNVTLTAAGFRIMTPEYASPEQIRGEAVTTSSDVYSLGLVLYELLAGRQAYRFFSQLPQDIVKVVCDTEPQRPSAAIQAEETPAGRAASATEIGTTDAYSVRVTTCAKLRKRLQGDLDNIVLMALRKEPGRRYASAEQFAEDIRRNLENVPVVAHQDSALYRTTKFIRRHRAAVAASAAIVVLLIVGLGATLYEARVARQQAGIAREQRARAERRFNDVRKLANSLMFEVHDSIRDLPGATPARKLLLDRAVEYLDGLSQEANGDLSLQRELAAAYDRVGDLLGYAGAANLGDIAGARQSYLKALAIREAAGAANPNDATAQGELINEYFHMAFVLEDAGEYQEALNTLKRALPIAQKLAATHGETRYKDWLAGIYWKSGGVSLQADDPKQALEDFRQSVAIREPIALDSNADAILSTHLAADYIGLANAEAFTGDLGHAIENGKKAIQSLELLCNADPNNATLREYLGEAYDNYATLQKQNKQFAEALGYAEKSNQLFRRLQLDDPANVLARDNVALTALNVGDILQQQGRAREARPRLREAIAFFESVEKKNRYEVGGLVTSYYAMARACARLSAEDKTFAEKKKHLMEARACFEKSLRTSRENATAVQGAVDVPSVASIESELKACEESLANL
jgi:serine/threonine protein kinase